MRPTSAVDICNLALDQLKQTAITSIDTPRTNTEFVCARWYDATRQECLMQHPWKFATKRGVLTASTDVIPFGYTYAFNVPTDYIRLVSLGDDFLGGDGREFEVENGQLLLESGEYADGTSLYVRYVHDITNVSRFTPLFIKYLVLQLALNMSTKFSISSTIKKDIREEFKDIEMQAKSINGQERRPKRIQHSRILAKRRGTSGLTASKYTVFPE